MYIIYRQGMRHLDASPMLMFLICLMLMEAIGADHDEMVRFVMVLVSGATKVVKLLGRTTVLVV